MKKIFVLLLVAGVLFAGCNNNNNNSSSVPPSSTSVDPNNMPGAENTLTMTEQRVQGLVLNEYPGLKITVDDMSSSELIAGSVIPVKIKLENIGDKTVFYSLGSGSYTTPQALWLDIPQLQTIMPEDYLPPSTRDMQYRELKPGQMIEHSLSIMAIQPNDNFNNYTSEVYDKYSTTENRMYIGNWNYADLNGVYPDLSLAGEGEYNASVYFTYYVMGEESSAAVGNPTGYAKHDFVIKLNSGNVSVSE